MGAFKLGKMTLRSLFGKPATVCYPAEKREPYEGMRGHVVNDLEVCILCGMCQRACPVGAIAVDRKAGDWTINPYECIQCACCVHECPKNCLSMGVEPTAAATSVSVKTLHKDMPAKPARPAAKAGAKAGAGAGAAARPKRQLTPEQEARVAAARAKKEAAKKAAEGSE